MDGPSESLRSVARIAAVLAELTGAYGFLHMMGAFGPVSCVTSSRSGSGESTGTSGGEATTTVGEVTRECEAGIDYLLGSAGGNAPVLFFWAVVLAGLVAVGGIAAWTGRRHVAWASALLGVVVSVIGVMSIGWYFLLPTLCLLVAAAALTVDARREKGRNPSAASR